MENVNAFEMNGNENLRVRTVKKAQCSVFFFTLLYSLYAI